MTKSEFENLLIYEKETFNVITKLKQERLPLIIWGAGDVASAVKLYLEKNEIFPVAVWVNEPKTNIFKNLPVMTLEEIKKKYDKFNIILGHSSFNLGDYLLENEPQICGVFYLVSILYEQYDNISYQFVKQNINHYFFSYQILEDEQSKKAMIAYLNTRMNNNIHYVQDCVEYEQDYFYNDIYQIGYDENYVDVGAFDGDTIKQFLEKCNGKYKKIYAFEPDKTNFKNLKIYTQSHKLHDILLYNIGTWKEKTNMYFNGEEDKRSSISLKEDGFEIVVDTLDNVLDGEYISLLKINFYHGVLETLEGAKKILKLCKPKLAIVVGFDEWALIKIPQYLKNNFPNYRLFLRYNRCMPACLTLYAI